VWGASAPRGGDRIRPLHSGVGGCGVRPPTLVGVGGVPSGLAVPYPPIGLFAYSSGVLTYHRLPSSPPHVWGALASLEPQPPIETLPSEHCIALLSAYIIA
jgi:hypothetical protein